MIEYLKSRALIIMLLGCVVFSYLMYSSWNNPHYFDKEIYHVINDSHMKFFIDECNISDKKLFIRGWAFNESYPEKGYVTINLKVDSREVIIPLKTYTRPDVSAAFNLGNDRARYGFYGSLLLPKTSIQKPTLTINIINQDVNSRKEHVCQ